MAKIEVARTPVEEEKFDLRAVLRDPVNLMRERTEAKGLSLNRDLAGDLPSAIQSDEGKLRQVLINLIGNVISSQIKVE